MNNENKNIHSKKLRSWSTILHVFFKDLKRILKNPIAICVLAGALILPNLYSWCALLANWDPYANLDTVNVAVVNNDKPTQSSLAGELDLGSQIMNALDENRQLNWIFTDEKDALNQTTAGKYYAAIILPENFSQSIANLFEGEDTRDFAKIDVFVNERENMITTLITDTASSTLENQINTQFSATVSSVVIQKVKDAIGGALDSKTTLSNTLSDKISTVSNTINSAAQTIDQTQTTSIQVEESVNQALTLLNDTHTECINATNSLNQANLLCNNARTNINNIINELTKRGIEWHIIMDVLNNLNDVLNKTSNSISELNTTVSKIDTTVNDAITLLNQTEQLLTQAADLSTSIKASLQDISKKLNDIAIKIGTTTDTNNPDALSKLLSVNAENIGTFMAAPVQLETNIINHIENYGTGLSPFFASLSMWIGGIVLLALLRIEVKPPKKRKLSSKQAYIVRGLLFSLIGILQGAICCGVIVLLGIQCENPFMYILTGMISSFVFVNIIYMLASCFKHVGKAFVILLIIIQIPGSSGMFPIEMMPKVFQVLHPLLPFTYSVGAMRETIVAFNLWNWLWCIFVLCIMFIIAWLLGIYARSALTNINKLFDKKLAAAEVYEVETKNHISNPEILNAVIKELKNTKSLGKKVKESLFEFEIKFKGRRRKSLLFMAIGPLSVLVISSIIFKFVSVDINTKVIIMILWLIVLFGSAINIVVLEFTHSKLKKQARIAAIEDPEFAAKIKQKNIDIGLEKFLPKQKQITQTIQNSKNSDKNKNNTNTTNITDKTNKKNNTNNITNTTNTTTNNANNKPDSAGEK